MRQLAFATCSTLALAAATPAAAAEQAPRPAPRPATGEAAAAPEATMAERYRQTMLGLGLAEELVEEALDGDDQPLEGDNLIEAALQPDRSDLPAMRERGFIRLGIAPDPLMIAFDGERAIGVAVELARELEGYLHEQPGKAATPTVVVPMPLPRATIAERLQQGMTDFTALMAADARDEGLATTEPLLTDARDVVVTGDGVEVADMDDLVDTPIYVQQDGRYARNLQRLNRLRAQEGREPLDVRYVDPRLDDYDLVEMVQVGIIPATVMVDFKAAFWNRVYPDVTVREDLALTPPDDAVWAVRKANPKLREALDGFAERVKKGTLVGNVLLERYFGSTNWIKNITDSAALRRIDEVEPVIRRFSEEFDFESDLVLAQAYQESQLDQSKRSHVGALGVMQVMPATAADPVVGIPDISGLENNVHAGIKYLRWLRDTYFSDPAIAPLDQTLLSFAAYNAGPGGVARARERAETMGLDPDVWFENVELAITRAVSREPAVYVRNIFKYYVAYRLLKELEQDRDEALAEVAEVTEEIADLPPEEQLQALEEAEIVTGPAPAAEEQAAMGTDALPGDDPDEHDEPDEQQAKVDDGLRAR